MVSFNKRPLYMYEYSWPWNESIDRTVGIKWTITVYEAFVSLSLCLSLSLSLPLSLSLFHSLSIFSLFYSFSFSFLFLFLFFLKSCFLFDMLRLYNSSGEKYFIPVIDRRVTLHVIVATCAVYVGIWRVMTKRNGVQGWWWSPRSRVRFEYVLSSNRRMRECSDRLTS